MTNLSDRLCRMRIVFLPPRVRRIAAAVTATLALSTLAQAAPGGQPGSPADNGVLPPGLVDKVLPPGVDKKVDPPVVPEANPGLALIPVVAAVLFFSTRRLWPVRPAVATSGQKPPGEPNA
jgi:hypothetical protein